MSQQKFGDTLPQLQLWSTTSTQAHAVFPRSYDVYAPNNTATLSKIFVAQGVNGNCLKYNSAVGVTDAGAPCGSGSGSGGGSFSGTSVASNIAYFDGVHSVTGSANLIFNGTKLTASQLSAFGSDTQVQFNDGGVFAGDSTFTFNKATGVLYSSSELSGANLSSDFIITQSDNNLSELWLTSLGTIKLFGTGASGFALLDPRGVTADRTFVFPNKDGTFAMLSDITGGGTFSGTASPALANAIWIVNDLHSATASHFTISNNTLTNASAATISSGSSLTLSAASGAGISLYGAGVTNLPYVNIDTTNGGVLARMNQGEYFSLGYPNVYPSGAANINALSVGNNFDVFSLPHISSATFTMATSTLGAGSILKSYGKWSVGQATAGTDYTTPQGVKDTINASTTVSFALGASTQYVAGDRSLRTFNTDVDTEAKALLNASSTESFPICATNQVPVWSGTIWSCGTSLADGGSNWKFTSGGSSSGGVISPTSTNPVGIIVTASSTFTNTLSVGISPTFAFSNCLVCTVSSSISFLQNVIQNTSNTASASAQWVAQNSTGTDSTGFLAAGIVSPTFNNLNNPINFFDSTFIDSSNASGLFNISVSSFAATSRIQFTIGSSLATSTIQGYWQVSTASPTNFSVFGNAFLGTASTNTFSITGLTSGSLLVGGGVAGPLTATATVATSKGGTGTGTSFTNGSIVFAGPSGVYAQDNTGLFWDDTNNRLSINAGAAPGSMLSISSTLPSSGTAVPGISLTVSNLATSSAILIKDNAGTNLFSISPTGGTILAVTSDTKQAVKIKNSTGDTIFSVDTVNGWFTMGATSVPDRPLRVGPGTNLNVNTNVNFLIQDRTDARMGAAVADSGIFLKSSGGLYAYDYFNAVAKNLALQEFGGNTGIVTTVPGFTLSVSGTSYQTATSILRDDFLVDRYSATSVITVGNGTAGCLKIKDVSGAGFTYCKAQAGTLTCNTTACR